MAKLHKILRSCRSPAGIGDVQVPKIAEDRYAMGRVRQRSVLRLDTHGIAHGLAHVSTF